MDVLLPMFKQAKFSLLEQCEIIERCGELLDRGFSVQQVIEILELYYSKKKEVIFRVMKQSLFEGQSFYESLRASGFSSIICEFIYLAEKNGDLANGCRNAGLTYRKLILKANQLKIKLIYPMVLFFFIFLIFLFIRLTIYPNFELLQAQNTSPKTSTQSILITIPTILFYLFFFFSISIFFVFIYWKWYQKKVSEIKMWRLLSRMPILKNGIQSYLTYYFSYQLYSLLNAGISIQNCLLVFKEIQTKGWLRDLAILIEQQLLLGNNFATSIASTKLFSKELEKSIYLGDQNGKLVLELEHVSEFNFLKLEQSMMKAIHFIQPMMFTFIAIIIICLYLSILLPIFQMMEGI